MTAKPFQFDRAFASEATADEAMDVAEPTFTAFDVDRARDSGFVEGRRVALAEEAVVGERRRTDALAAIADHLAALSREMAAGRDRLTEDAAMLALAICRAMLAEPAVDRFGEEVVARVRDVIERLPTAPRVVVRVDPATRASIEEPLAALSPPDTELRLVADAALAPGEARVAWGEGELLIDLEERWRAIHGLIARTLGRDLPEAGDPAAVAGDVPRHPLVADHDQPLTSAERHE